MTLTGSVHYCSLFIAVPIVSELLLILSPFFYFPVASLLFRNFLIFYYEALWIETFPTILIPRTFPTTGVVPRFVSWARLVFLNDNLAVDPLQSFTSKKVSRDLKISLIQL